MPSTHTSKLILKKIITEIDVDDYRLINLCFFFILIFGFLYSILFNIIPEGLQLSSSYEGEQVNSIGLSRAFNAALHGDYEAATQHNKYYLGPLIWFFTQFWIRGLTLYLIKINKVFRGYLILDIIISSMSFVFIFYVFIIP